MRAPGQSELLVTRSQVFHLFFAGSCSLLAAARLGILAEESLDPALGISLGRAGACGLLAMAFGRAAGAAAHEVAPVAVLFTVSWLQLGLSAFSSQMALRWGLFCSGALCAAVAIQSLQAVLEGSRHGIVVKDRLLMIMDLVRVVTAVSMLVWLTATMSWQPSHEDVGVQRGSFFGPHKQQEVVGRGSFIGYAFESLLDGLAFCGTGHLLLKEPSINDSLCQALLWPSASASCDQSDASICTSAGQPNRSQSSECSESSPLCSSREARA